MDIKDAALNRWVVFPSPNSSRWLAKSSQFAFAECIRGVRCLISACRIKLGILGGRTDKTPLAGTKVKNFRQPGSVTSDLCDISAKFRVLCFRKGRPSADPLDPNVVRNHVADIEDGKCIADVALDGAAVQQPSIHVELAFCYTAGREDYESLRHSDSPVILICSSVDSPDSLANVKKKVLVIFTAGGSGTGAGGACDIQSLSLP
ncbi:hypothetical protein C8J56DRAFT_891180 [Mycena floridula]|nr:hypothetical protein C8J56DRAFT_891180 [Mycena floridula]